MTQYDESTVDLEALQAQVNMAMAETEELVSSWVRPSTSSKANTSGRPKKKSLEEIEKELQEYLRKPPRLGVGAPIPETVGPTAQEEARVKNKLVGNDRKRRRTTDSTIAKPQEDSAEEDEEENKKGESSTVRKKIRTDPFSLPTKRKVKQTNNKEIGRTAMNGIHSGPTSNPFSLASASAPNGLLDHSSGVLADSHTTTPSPISPISQNTNGGPTSPISKKKKKKKKHKRLAQPVSPETASTNGPVGLATVPLSSPPSTNKGTENGTNNKDQETRLGRVKEKPRVLEVSTAGPAEADVDEGIAQSPIVTNGIPKVGSSILRLNPPGPPLLNLSGPPPSLEDEDAIPSPNSRKKKRRRKKKNKSHRAENKV